MKQWDSLTEGYLKECETRGLSEEYRAGVRREMERLGSWLKRRRPRPCLEEVDGPVLIEYLKRRSRFRTKATISDATSKVRCIGEYLVRQKVWARNPMRWVKGPRMNWRGQMPRRIGGEQLKALWEAAAGQREAYRKQQAVAVLALLYGTGLRRGELERLNVDDWKREENLLAVDGRKTGCERSVPLGEPVARCLEAYLPLRQNLLEKVGGLEEKSLLVNRLGKRLGAQSIGLLIHRLAHKANVPLVTVHQFRHTCASDLLENGASLAQVQGMLGHKCVQTTSRYLHIADPARAQALKRHPLNEYLPALLAKEEKTT